MKDNRLDKVFHSPDVVSYILSSPQTESSERALDTRCSNGARRNDHQSRDRSAACGFGGSPRGTTRVHAILVRSHAIGAGYDLVFEVAGGRGWIQMGAMGAVLPSPESSRGKKITL